MAKDQALEESQRAKDYAIFMVQRQRRRSRVFTFLSSKILKLVPFSVMAKPGQGQKDQ
jgi:hypothetical protein